MTAEGIIGHGVIKWHLFTLIIQALSKLHGWLLKLDGEKMLLCTAYSFKPDLRMPMQLRPM